MYQRSISKRRSRSSSLISSDSLCLWKLSTMYVVTCFKSDVLLRLWYYRGLFLGFCCRFHAPYAFSSQQLSNCRNSLSKQLLVACLALPLFLFERFVLFFLSIDSPDKTLESLTTYSFPDWALSICVIFWRPFSRRVKQSGTDFVREVLYASNTRDGISFRKVARKSSIAWSFYVAYFLCIVLKNALYQRLIALLCIIKPL